MRSLFQADMRMGRVSGLLWCLASCGPAAGLAQTAERTLSPAQLAEDFAVLRRTFEQAHAGLYRHTPKAQMDSAFDQVAATLDRPRTELEFYRILAPLIDRIHDAHSALRLSPASRERLSHKTAFPLDVRYVDGRAYVEKNFGADTTVPLGAEILAINGVPMAEITERVLIPRSTDGLNRVPKYEVANVNFWMSYLRFVDESEVFEVELREPATGRTRRHSIAGVSASVVQAGQFKTQTHSAFALEFVEQGRVALMTIPHFADRALAGQFAEAFRSIAGRGVRTLVIDIRDNGGGYDELNTDLLSYLVPRPFRFYRGFTARAKDWQALQYTEYDPDDFWHPADVQRYSKAERAELLRRKTLAEALDYYSQSNPAAGMHQPKREHHFAGDLYLLFNGRSGSSGGEVPALLHFLGVGTLIGEEPNASYQGTTAGILPILTLPNSKISASVPLVAYENAVLPGLFVGRGVTPHFTVGQALDDAIRGRDTVMEFALALIRARGSPR